MTQDESPVQPSYPVQGDTPPAKSIYVDPREHSSLNTFLLSHQSNNRRHKPKQMVLAIAMQPGHTRNFLLIERPRDTSILPGFLNFPGGRMENDESPEDCARREFAEETGLTFKDPKLVGVIVPSLHELKINPQANHCVYIVTGRGSYNTIAARKARASVQGLETYYATHPQLNVPHCVHNLQLIAALANSGEQFVLEDEAFGNDHTYAGRVTLFRPYTHPFTPAGIPHPLAWATLPPV